MDLYLWQKQVEAFVRFLQRRKRDGLFTAYGRTSELVYEKNYKDGELDGNFTCTIPLRTAASTAILKSSRRGTQAR